MSQGFPDGLFDAAHHCLMQTAVAQKLLATEAVARAWEAGELALAGDSRVETIEAPGRPSRPELVESFRLPARNIGRREGHAAFIHALAHIEFNAINLAWDAVYRFRDLPRGFYDDWVRIAREEALHFRLLQGYLAELGHAYGDFPAHDNLWRMARDTAADALMRMALVPRVLEARGLDVTPGMIERLANQGQRQAVEILQVIYRDEIGHVQAGSRWFHFLCRQRGLDPEAHFQELIEQYARQRIRPPFNRQGRDAAGFSQAELDYLEALL